MIILNTVKEYFSGSSIYSYFNVKVSRQSGCVGLSQGGDMTVWGAAMDERIKAAVSVCGWSPFCSRDITPLTASYNYPHLKNCIGQDKKLPFDKDHIAAMIAPRPFLNISASGDQFFPNKKQLTEADQYIKCVCHMLGAENHFETIKFNMTHRYNHNCAKLTLEWFDRWLG